MSISPSLAIVKHIWQEVLDLPIDSLSSVRVPGNGHGLPSSFKVGDLAQGSIALSALAAATFYSLRSNDTRDAVPIVTVPRQHACAEFCSERLYTLDGIPPKYIVSPVGGLHRTADGYVRIYDGFPHHRQAALKILGLDVDGEEGFTREQIDAKLQGWKSEELEAKGVEHGAVIAVLRNYDQWDALPCATAMQGSPIMIRKVAERPTTSAGANGSKMDKKKCLRGIKVLEMSRVIAAPVAGKTLAVHGADVLWVTSPSLPALPALDVDVGRGKRTAQLDLQRAEDLETLKNLLVDADVFLLSYRPGSLAARGLSAVELDAQSKKGIICANLSAWGPDGPWKKNRGFDSIVQTSSGMNVSEAEHFGQGSTPKPMPCQALDHASGYFLAAGIIAALYRRAVEGGSYQVEVSLAGTMRYLRSLGQYEDASGFDCPNYLKQEDVESEFLETKDTALGSLVAVSHAASIDDVDIGWDIVPKPLGADKAEWL
ncbi:hypothetical protein DV736_g62, partial [Chaetothyriales sp. CBS 134916]